MNSIRSSLSTFTNWIADNAPSIAYSLANAYDPVATVVGTLGIAALIKGVVDFKSGKKSKKLIATEITAGIASLAFAAYRIFSLQQSSTETPQHVSRKPGPIVDTPKRSSNAASFLQFPSRDVLTSCLEKHLPNDEYYKDKKIIEFIAKEFAGPAKLPIEFFQPGLSLSLDDLNKKLHLEESTIRVLRMNLEQALRDCSK